MATTKTETWEIEGKRVDLSKSDKLLYPEEGYSKHDVVEYFRRVAPAMVPHLRGKPLTLRRFPDGIEEEGFFSEGSRRTLAGLDTRGNRSSSQWWQPCAPRGLR